MRRRSRLTCTMFTAAIVLMVSMSLEGDADAKSVNSDAMPKALSIADDPAQSRHRDLEDLFASDKLEQGLDIAEERLKQAPHDPELYVHVFRFRFALGERMGHKKLWGKKGFGKRFKDKEAYYEGLVTLSERGLKLQPKHPRLLWGLGIAKGRLATSRGVIASLRTAKQIEDAWLAVVKSDYRYSSLNGVEVIPCDTMVALGMFYRLVPDWWIVKLIAGTRGDIDKSIAWLQKANTCRPGGIGTLKELGVAYLCKADRDDDSAALTEGRAQLKAALALTPVWEIQRIDQADARRLLKDPSGVCGYSRDGQQRYDEDQLDKPGDATTPALQPAPERSP